MSDLLLQLDEAVALSEFLLGQDAPELRWARAIVCAFGARGFAMAGRAEEAISLLPKVLHACGSNAHRRAYAGV